MAANSALNPTLMDLAKVTDPDGRISLVVEMLNETNEILPDMTWVEGNMTTGNMSSVRSGIPAPTWRSLYQGVQPTKATNVQIVDTCGTLEAYAEVDKKLVSMAKDSAAFRLQEERAHIEGMNQEVAETLFFGNEDTASNEFTGLAPRFNDFTAETWDNVIPAGGAGTDNASIWLVVWSPTTVHGIIPQGSTAGLQIQDLGEQTLETAVDGNGGRMQIFRSHYTWDVGLTVRDWRYVVRICNIDKSDLTTDAATGADLAELMFQAMELVPSLSVGRPAFYMNRTVRTFLRQQSANKVSNSTLTTTMVGGVRVTDFHGVPIRRVDKLAADEALVAVS